MILRNKTFTALELSPGFPDFPFPCNEHFISASGVKIKLNRDLAYPVGLFDSFFNFLNKSPSTKILQSENNSEV